MTHSNDPRDQSMRQRLAARKVELEHNTVDTDPPQSPERSELPQNTRESAAEDAVREHLFRTALASSVRPKQCVILYSELARGLDVESGKFTGFNVLTATDCDQPFGAGLVTAIAKHCKAYLTAYAPEYQPANAASVWEGIFSRAARSTSARGMCMLVPVRRTLEGPRHVYAEIPISIHSALVPAALTANLENLVEYVHANSQKIFGYSTASKALLYRANPCGPVVCRRQFAGSVCTSWFSAPRSNGNKVPATERGWFYSPSLN